MINQFTSDFKIVAQFFKNKSIGKTEKQVFLNSKEKVNYPAEVLELFSVFTKDRRYKEIIPSILEKQQKGAEVNMCEIAQELVEKGILKVLFKLVDKGLISTNDAAKEANMTEQQFLEEKENATQLA